jgi:gamma-glutamylcyclotransferase (GGCT)/AIG2-like uncharacterized protein YtfP
MENRLFVYGTLHPSHAPRELADLVSRFRSLGKGSVQGHLYDFGAYPGIILDDNGPAIPGEVFLLPPDTDLFLRLDDYEGYLPENPSESLFLRQPAIVTMQDGSHLLAWIYVYNGPAPEAEL